MMLLIRSAGGKQGAPTTTSFPLLALALTFLAMIVGNTAWAAPTAKPKPAALRALKQSEIRLGELDRLNGLVRQTIRAAESLEQASKDSEQLRISAQQASDEAAASISEAAQCLAALRVELAARHVALNETDVLAAQSLRATQLLAQAEASQLAAAAAESDAVFRRRAAAEKALADRQGAVQAQAGECLRRSSKAASSVYWATENARRFDQQISALPATFSGVTAQWEKLTATYGGARNAGLVDVPVSAAALPSGERIQALEALRRLAPEVPQAGLAAIPGELSRLTQDALNIQRVSADLSRLEDAAAYIDLVAGPQASACREATCPSFVDERRMLALRATEARLVLNAAVAEVSALIDSPARLDDELAPQRTALQRAIDAVQISSRALPSALAEVAAGSDAVLSAARKMAPPVAAAYAAAKRDWERAFQLAYGKLPPVTASLSGAAPDQLQTAAAMANGHELVLRSHAYELFNAWDQEPKGFGAYTYVLLRSASDLKTPAVRKRFIHLIETLQKQPEARLVGDDIKPQVNLFCIPGTDNPTRDEEALPGLERLHYASDLGQQLKLRAQNGLLTRQEVAQRLINSPGPFLLTVPGRMASVNSGAAVLLADLSGYPEDAIADLAANYMSGLLADFPSQQALWRPPTRQRVALMMIHLAANVGGMMTNVLPTAQAAQPE